MVVLLVLVLVLVLVVPVLVKVGGRQCPTNAAKAPEASGSSSSSSSLSSCSASSSSSCSVEVLVLVVVVVVQVMLRLAHRHLPLHLLLEQLDHARQAQLGWHAHSVAAQQRSDVLAHAVARVRRRRLQCLQHALHGAQHLLQLKLRGRRVRADGHHVRQPRRPVLLHERVDLHADRQPPVAHEAQCLQLVQVDEADAVQPLHLLGQLRAELLDAAPYQEARGRGSTACSFCCCCCSAAAAIRLLLLLSVVVVVLLLLLLLVARVHQCDGNARRLRPVLEEVEIDRH